MKKGIDYIGVCVAFYCHDGEGNYVFHKRSKNCRDEQGCWDCGGGGLKFGETVEEALHREVKEEYGVSPIEFERLGCEEVIRESGSTKTHWIAFKYKVRVPRKEVYNAEPEMHSELGWYQITDLPEPLHSQVYVELEKYKKKL